MHHLFILSLILLLIFWQTYSQFLSLNSTSLIHTASWCFFLYLCVFVPLGCECFLQDSEVRPSVNSFTPSTLFCPPLRQVLLVPGIKQRLILTGWKTQQLPQNSIHTAPSLCVSPDYSCAHTPPQTHTHSHTRSECTVSRLSLSPVTVAQIIQTPATPPHCSSNHLPLLAIFLQHSFSVSHIFSYLVITAVWCRISPLQHTLSFLVLHLSCSSCCFPVFLLYSWAAGVYQHETRSLTFITIRVNVSVPLFWYCDAQITSHN